ncbi:MAG: hypothetical protein HQL68_03710, partial [Magnetococcales bacterium]|nr:hypothetical protein [Magnetococcales bacterium]
EETLKLVPRAEDKAPIDPKIFRSKSSEPTQEQSSDIPQIEKIQTVVSRETKPTSSTPFKGQKREQEFVELLKNLVNQLPERSGLPSRTLENTIDGLVRTITNGATLSEPQIVENLGTLGEQIGNLELSSMEDDALDGLDDTFMKLASLLQGNDDAQPFVQQPQPVIPQSPSQLTGREYKPLPTDMGKLLGSFDFPKAHRHLPHVPHFEDETPKENKIGPTMENLLAVFNHQPVEALVPSLTDRSLRSQPSTVRPKEDMNDMDELFSSFTKEPSANKSDFSRERYIENMPFQQTLEDVTPKREEAVKSPVAHQDSFEGNKTNFHTLIGQHMAQATPRRHS